MKNFFFFCLSEICDARRVPLLCACKIEAKILRSEKKVLDGDDGVEMISFLQNDNKMKIKMNGVNHVESPIITCCSFFAHPIK